MKCFLQLVGLPVPRKLTNSSFQINMNCLVCKTQLKGVYIVSTNPVCKEEEHFAHIQCFPGNLSRGSGRCFVWECQRECEGYETLQMEAENQNLGKTYLNLCSRVIGMFERHLNDFSDRRRKQVGVIL